MERIAVVILASIIAALLQGAPCANASVVECAAMSTDLPPAPVDTIATPSTNDSGQTTFTGPAYPNPATGWGT